MNFVGKAKRLEDIDLPRIGHTIGVGEDEIHAFMDVEAAGSGFDKHGRPKMLFEPHIFFRLLGPTKARSLAVAQGLAYEKWKPKGYPPDSYPRLQSAMKINHEIALMSASWGLGQIMGFNHANAGYVTASAMVRDFMEDEDNHLEAMIRILKSFKIDDDLHNHNWHKIENVYNGGGFNGAYAGKMARAFERWQKIKDTPWKPDPDPVAGREKELEAPITIALAKPPAVLKPVEIIQETKPVVPWWKRWLGQ